MMKHSKGVARGVYSTPGCKMKLWKSNLLHSQRPIAFITTEALNQRLYFTKINITVGRYSLPVGGSKWSFAYLIHACSKVVHKILLGLFLQSMSYVQCFHPTHSKLRKIDCIKCIVSVLKPLINAAICSFRPCTDL